MDRLRPVELTEIAARGASMIIESSAMDGLAADIVITLFSADPPIHDDGELEALLHVPLSTIRPSIQRALRESPGLTLHRLVQWARHLRAIELAARGMHMLEIAFTLRVDERTLQRQAVRLTGRTFRTCVEMGPHVAIELLRAQLRAPPRTGT